MHRNVLSTPKNWARLVHDLCFSLNLAWELLFPLSTVGSSLGWLYFWPPMRKLFFYVHTIEPEVIAVQVVGSIGLALLLFSTLWLLGRSSFLETFLRTIAGDNWARCVSDGCAFFCAGVLPVARPFYQLFHWIAMAFV